VKVLELSVMYGIMVLMVLAETCHEEES